MQLVVTLTDENDNIPVFLPFPKSTEVREDVPSGTTILAVGAVDADEGSNGNVLYEITDGDFDSKQNCFSLSQVI